MSTVLPRRRLLLGGLGALGGIVTGFAPPLHSSTTTSLPMQRHFAPTAERVIFLHMAGGPSSLELFDDKPELLRRNGEPAPASFFKTQKFAFVEKQARLLGARYAFARHGQVGAAVSELLPHTARVVDKLTIVRSMQTDQFNHLPAELVLNTGAAAAGRPSMGAWLAHALGDPRATLPPFVTMLSGVTPRFAGEVPWTNGFLPSTTRGVRLHGLGEPVSYLALPAGITRAERRRTLDLAAALQKDAADSDHDRAQLERSAQHELAYSLQASLPEVMDLTREQQHTLDAYGVKDGQAGFGRNCLIARRLVERGVRFVHLVDSDWDHHGIATQRLDIDLPRKCVETDRGAAALIDDLDERGLLDTTLVVWGGEFGRTPFCEGDGGRGRDHHPRCFTMWMAGGGLKRGHVHGATDELGWDVVDKPVSINDLQATLLRCLGFDHERLTFRSSGRDFRLTDVSGRVVTELLR